MRLHEEVRYDADVETVFAMLCDERFREDVCEATYALRYAVSVNADGDGARVSVDRVMPADLPPAIRTFVGDEIEIVQTEIWKSPDAQARRSADVSMRISGKPASMSGVIRLEPDNGGCRQTFDGDVRVSVLFVGARIEAAIADAIRFAISKEAELGRRRLTAD